MEALEQAGISRKVVDNACNNQMSGHWFGASQWALPSAAHYQTLQALMQKLTKPYEEITTWRDTLRKNVTREAATGADEEVPSRCAVSECGRPRGNRADQGAP